MIKSELHYQVTLREAAKFAKAVESADRDTVGLDPLLRKAHRDALQSLLDDLRTELAEYEAAHVHDPAARLAGGE